MYSHAMISMWLKKCEWAKFMVVEWNYNLQSEVGRSCIATFSCVLGCLCSGVKWVYLHFTPPPQQCLLSLWESQFLQLIHRGLSLKVLEVWPDIAKSLCYSYSNVWHMPTRNIFLCIMTFKVDIDTDLQYFYGILWSCEHIWLVLVCIT